MCSAFPPDYGYDNSTIILIGDVYGPNTKCLGKVCLHKKTFQSRSRNDYQCPQCASVCQVRNIRFEEQTNSFFLSFGQGFTFLKRVRSQFKMLLEMSVVLRQVLFQQRDMRICWWLSNKSEIHLWLWKVWILVVCSQSCFYVTRAHKDNIKRQNMLLFAER